MACVNCMTQFAVSLEVVSIVTGVPNVEIAEGKCITYIKEKQTVSIYFLKKDSWKGQLAIGTDSLRVVWVRATCDT